MMLVYCGLRNYGEDILKKFYDKDGFEVESEKVIDYIKKYDNVLMWVECNCEVISKKIM